ncbi:competence protein CoiA family protein [Paraburkholderia sp. RL18-085-BIA-A]|uniref:competence protein CoiA family protein n=1 Tax=Paraburkholderia sp. RL18-085-BIA-A TaxID=3031633 RepID=UPI0038B89873
MKEARSRLTGRHVDAEDANDGQHLYLCPECDAPVSLRAGRSKQAYFAHMPGSSGKYCGLYVEALGFANGSLAVDSHDLDRVRELRLGIRLADGLYPRGWGLELSIPTAEFAGSEITVDVGGRTLTIDCKATGGDVFRHTVAEPQSDNYRILTVVPQRSSLQSRPAFTCPGLYRDRATVFGEIGRPNARIIPRVSELKLGRTYVFVWPSVLNALFPEQLERQALKARAEWSAAIVTLSSPLADDSQAWLQAFTGLSLITSATEIMPVWPPYVRKVTAGSVEAPENIDVIVHGGQYTPGGVHTVRGMFARGRMHPIAADATGVTDAFFRLAPEKEPLVELTCPETTRVQLTIDFTLQALQKDDAVELTATDAGGAELVVALHDELAGTLLSRIRSGELKFSHLALPPNVKGTLYTGADGIWDACLSLHASGFRAKAGSSLKALPPGTAEELKKLICNRTCDVLLDFGAFGRAKTCDRVSQGDAALGISPELRNRLLAFLFQIQRRSPATVRASKMTEAEILAAFSSARPRGLGDATWRTLSHAIKELRAKH